MVLLLGVGYDRNTSFHLAEYRAPGTPERTDASPLLEEGRRVWREYRDLALDDEPFAAIDERGRDGDHDHDPQADDGKGAPLKHRGAPTPRARGT